MKDNKSTYISADGHMCINGTFEFEGSLKELKSIIDKTIEEYGEEAICKMQDFGRFPHHHSTYLRLMQTQKEESSY